MKKKALWRVPRVLNETGLTRSQLYRLVAIGEFPKPVKVGRCSTWVSLEVDRWVEARVAARDAFKGDQ